MDIKNILTEIIVSNVNDASVTEDLVRSLIAVPPDEKLGDFSLPCFKLIKGRNPKEVAESLKNAIENSEFKQFFSEIKVVGAYLNFYLNRMIISKTVIQEILTSGENYGRSGEGEGRKVIVEYSSPNIAKPFHIGHLCSTAIGNSLSRIYDFLGYDVVRINHIGDWGTQFGKLISAYKRWGDRETIEKDPINELLKIYVKFHAEAKEHPELEDEARLNFKLLEEGDPEVTALWKFFVDVSLKEFNRMYDLLDIHFDSFAGESFYSDKMPEIVEILREKSLLEDSEGAKVVRFDDPNMPPCIILKSDGSTIYATRDIAAALYRKRHYDFYKNIYVVGTPQALHFKQVFGVLKKMGYEWADDCVHVGFGYVRFPDRVLSTRNGDVVLLEDVLNESIAKTKEIITDSGTVTQIENIDEAANIIGIGAVLFEFQKNGRERDIVFELSKMLDFEGESGPYVQYTYARGRSVLRKAFEMGITYKNVNLELLTDDQEYQIVKILMKLRSAVRDAASKNEPYIVTRYIIELCKAFNKFYNSTSVLKSDEGVRAARLVLIDSTTKCIKEALHLIGIGVVEKM
ncbi:MAG: arginine--tRNA ligase [Clostridia bacterium]|nr:arginine--tRNA ligase [Clostridia bacterium]